MTQNTTLNRTPDITGLKTIKVFFNPHRDGLYEPVYRGEVALIGLNGFTVVDKNGYKYYTFFRDYISMAKFLQHCEKLSITKYICEADYIEQLIKKADEIEPDIRVWVEVKGSRIYVKGDTYQVRDTLKSIGCRWNPRRRVWFTDNGNVDQIVAKLEDAGATVLNVYKN
jgi:predicted transcriptional regulator with HTH domain